MKFTFKHTILILSVVLLTFFVLDAQDTIIIPKSDYVLTFTHQIDCNPIEDQAGSGTCWSFSTNSFIESELAKSGKDPIDLSEMFFVRMTYLDKARKYIRYHGLANFSEGSLGHDVMRMYTKYGAVPEEAYTGLTDGKTRHSHGPMVKDLKRLLDDMIETREIPDDWEFRFNMLLDKHLGPFPKSFTYEGQTFNPRDFATEYVDIDPTEFVSLTSFMTYPFDERIVLEIPDNYAHQPYYNISVDNLLRTIDYALEKGHSMVWDCDVSDRGFSSARGLAIYPDINSKELAEVNEAFRSPTEERQVTDATRQEQFDSYTLTDDHLMHIVGRAEDQKGTPYYYVKNSWGERPGLDGYLFASKGYVMKNTIAIMLHKEGIPTDIREKIFGLTPKTE